MNERSGTLELEQISVVFRNKKQTIDAVRDVNITIPTGTVFGLIGYSGAGKVPLPAPSTSCSALAAAV